MKRSLRRILVCVLLGAATTVAVAWGSMVWTKSPPAPREIGARHAFDDGVVAIAAWSASWCATWITMSARDTSDGRSPTNASTPEALRAYLRPVDRFDYVDRLTGPPWRSTPSTIGGFVIGASGWPFRALWYEMAMGGPGDGPYRIYGGVELSDMDPSPSYGALALPYRVRTLGFALDTMFWGLVWFGALFGPGATRRLARRRRGCCAYCGYDLRGGGREQGVCPECGRASV